MTRYQVFFVINYSVATSGECFYDSEHPLDTPAGRGHWPAVETAIRANLDQQGGPPGRVGIYKIVKA